MPLTTRSVSPVDLSIHRLPASVQQDELQCVANGTVANLIRQLSSISRHAEQTFSEIHREVLKIDHRTNTLFLRVERLSQKVSQQSQSSNNLRGVADQASLEDAALRKAFKSCNIIDQHSLSRQTLPSSLQEQYQRCDAPPQLNQLNPYREDEKEALRYFSDPGYFFELWRQEILKGCNVEKKRTGRSPTSPSRQRRRQKEQQQQQQQQHQHLSQQQQNVLLNYHASSRSSDYTRFVAPQNQPAGTSRHQQRVHHQQQQRGGGMLPNSAAEIMHFPAEYQAPQALLASREFMQPPPGMSVIGGGGELTPTLGQQNYNQQPMFRQNIGIAAPLNEHQLPQQQGQNIAFHQMDAQMSQMGVAAAVGAMAFLDDDDDELPPPPPQTILGSAAFAQHSSPAAASSDSPPSLPSAGDGVQLPTEANNHHTIQNVPPPPPPPPQQPAAAGVQFRQKIPPAVSSTIPAPPPPPPPPPPANFAAKKINAATTADGNKTFAGEEEGHNVQRKPSTTSNGTHQGNRSQLLVQIQEGVKLKKVKQEEELAEKRAVATSDDVAAILRKRMEHCLGESDSSSSSAGGSPTADDNEWDD